MQQQDKLFLDYGDRIYSIFYVNAYSPCRRNVQLMNYDWTLLQTLIFIITPYFLMLALTSEDEDDDGSDGGLMTPAYAPSPTY